jgi:hypothetical protein
MDPYQRSRLVAPSGNPRGLNREQLAALEKWFAIRATEPRLSQPDEVEDIDLQSEIDLLSEVEADMAGDIDLLNEIEKEPH